VIFLNQSKDPGYTFPQPSRLPMAFHTRMAGYRATPLTTARHLPGHLGHHAVHVKDESHRLGLPAFKILGASWAFARELCRRGGLAADHLPTIAELQSIARSLPAFGVYSATDGNHGRAVARMAKFLGIPAHIYMPAGTATARIEAIASEGAEVRVIEGTYDDAVQLAAREAGEEGLLMQDMGWSGYELIPRWVVEGYATMFWEIEEQLVSHAHPDAVIVQIGVGSLADAAVRHYRRAGISSAPRLIGVEPDTAACALESARAGRIVTVPGPHSSIMAGMNCGTVSETSWPVLKNGIDCFVSIGDHRAVEGMKSLADEGVTAGETGAAGMGGLIELVTTEQGKAALQTMGLDKHSRFLILCTEGSTDPYNYERLVGRKP
jgi:diaminopropionate ammonia-lyase